MIYSFKYAFSNASSCEDRYKKNKNFFFFSLKSAMQGSNIETFWFLSKWLFFLPIYS